jgi:hypothetical protein
VITAAPAVSSERDGEMVEKRAFDNLGARGFSGFDKRAFDSFVSLTTALTAYYI